MDQLKRSVEYHQRQIRQWEAEGRSNDDPSVIAERAQLQAARAAYDAARPMCPPSTRLRCAEQALARAQRAQARIQEEHDQLVAAYEAELAAVRQRLEEAAASTAARQEALDERHREIAARAPADDDEEDDDISRDALVGLVHGLDGTVGPLLTTLRNLAGPETEMGKGIVSVIEQLDCLYTAAKVASNAASARDDRRKAGRPAPSAAMEVDPCPPAMPAGQGEADAHVDMDTRAPRRAGGPNEDDQPLNKKHHGASETGPAGGGPPPLSAELVRQKAGEAGVALEEVDLAQLDQAQLQQFAAKHNFIPAW